MNKIKSILSKLVNKIDSFYSKNTNKRVLITFIIIAMYVFLEKTDFLYNLVSNSNNYNYSENTNIDNNSDEEIQEAMDKDMENYKNSDAYKMQQKTDNIYQSEYCEELAYVEQITFSMIEYINNNSFDGMYEEENDQIHFNTLQNEGLLDFPSQYQKTLDFERFLQKNYRDSEIWDSKYKHLYNSLTYLGGALSALTNYSKRNIDINNLPPDEIPYILSLYKEASTRFSFYDDDLEIYYKYIPKRY